MDFLKKFAEPSEPKAETTDKSAPADQSQGDLLSNAKLVADAARLTIQKEPSKYENAEVAGAAANLLDAAQTYAKLDKTAGVGSYVEKAETYLHDYEASHTTKPKTPEEAKPSSEAAPTEAKKEEEPIKEETKPSTEEAPSHETQKEPASENPSGVGDYAKPSEGTGDSDQSGLGGIAKMAGGFFK